MQTEKKDIKMESRKLLDDLLGNRITMETFKAEIDKLISLDMVYKLDMAYKNAYQNYVKPENHDRNDI